MENVAQDLMGELAPDAPADAIHDRSLEALAVALLISDDGRAAENNSGQNKESVSHRLTIASAFRHVARQSTPASTSIRRKPATE